MEPVLSLSYFICFFTVVFVNSCFLGFGNFIEFVRVTAIFIFVVRATFKVILIGIFF